MSSRFLPRRGPQIETPLDSFNQADHPTPQHTCLHSVHRLKKHSLHHLTASRTEQVITRTPSSQMHSFPAKAWAHFAPVSTNALGSCIIAIARTHTHARARARARDAALDAKALLARINRVCLSAATEFVSEKRRVPASPSERTVGQLGGVPAREPARPPPLAHSWIPESGPAG